MTIKYKLKDAATISVKRWELLDSQNNYFVMRNIKFSIIFFLAFILLSSCSKDKEDNEKSFLEIKNETRSLIEPIPLVFNYAYANYTMVELCACDCNAANIAQNVLNSQFSNIPQYVDLTPLNYNCTQLFERLSLTCNKTDNV
jgi:Tfp pilus assembly protein PilP